MEKFGEINKLPATEREERRQRNVTKGGREPLLILEFDSLPPPLIFPTQKGNPSLTKPVPESRGIASRCQPSILDWGKRGEVGNQRAGSSI